LPVSDAAIWASEDGSEWRLIHDPWQLGGNGGQGIETLTEVDDLLVAGGENTAFDETVLPGIAVERGARRAISESDDGGLTWHRFSDPDGIFGDRRWTVVSDLLWDGTRLLAVGSRPGGVAGVSIGTRSG
jgi:hypothetical protein